MAHNISIAEVMSEAIYCGNTCWMQCIDAPFALKIFCIAANRPGICEVPCT
jgi:hypothetical protein